MSTISVRMPDYLHKRLRQLSEQEHTSINQLVTLAVAEKLLAIETMDYLEERAARGNLAAFDNVLSKVADIPAADYDKLPSDD